jgi:hypothetical protein
LFLSLTGKGFYIRFGFKPTGIDIMPIRMIAKELYRLQQEVDRLQAAIESAPLHERQGLREALRQLQAERDRMRKILDGEKVPAPYRQAR